MSDQCLCLSLEYSMTVKLLNEQHLDFLNLKGGCTGWSESTLVTMPHCWKSCLYCCSMLLIYKLMRDDQKVPSHLYFGLPGKENLNIISLQGNALSPSFFKLSYPFKIEDLFLVPQVLVYCLYDAFIASILLINSHGTADEKVFIVY